MNTVYIQTWGCQMNDNDSKRILELLSQTHGLRAVSTPEAADLLLMNTCSIREKAEHKVYAQLGRWAPFKKARPHTILGVGGCVASQEGERIRQQAPYVDLVFGPQTLHRLPEMLDQVRQKRGFVMDISFPEIEKFDRLPDPKAEGPTASVSIQEGCSKFCAYCIVPYTRGPEVDRPFDDILYEVHALAQQGAKDITLLGQNVNAYRGPMHDGRTADLGLLLRYLSEIDGVERLRFTTSHPVEFNGTLEAAFAQVPQLANHLHLPVQSGSNAILEAMGRCHTREHYIALIQRLKKIRPHLSVSSDFIVGFPGETEQDFEDTLDLVRTLNLDHSFSFIYSKRPGTPAADRTDTTPMDVKKERLNRLQNLLFEQGMAHTQAMLGTSVSVLVEGNAKRNPLWLVGRTENNRLVFLTHGQQHMIGHIVIAHVTQAHARNLTAKVVA